MITPIESVPYHFNPKSPLYTLLASTCHSLLAAAQKRYPRYTAIAKKVAAASLTTEQWRAATASWTAALIDSKATTRPWYTAMARIVHRASSALDLPQGSPFLPISVRGPGGHEVVVSMKALEEAFGWEADRCLAVGTFKEGLDFSDMAPGVFKAVTAYVTDNAALPVHLLPQLFIAADQWAAPAFLAAIVEKCGYLSLQRCRNVLGHLFELQGSIACHIDLSEFLPVYCRGKPAGRAERFLVAIQQAITPAECLAVAYEVSMVDVFTLRQLSALLEKEKVALAPKFYPATTREQLIASIRFGAAKKAAYPDVQRAYAALNLKAELDLWCQEVVIPLVSQTPSEFAGTPLAALGDLGCVGEHSRRSPALHLSPPAGPPTQFLKHERYSMPEFDTRRTTADHIMKAFQTNATWLDCADRGLTTFPAAISYLKTLRVLVISGNLFTALPDRIGDLKTLVNLSIDDNFFEILPEGISGLKALETLGVGGNLLEALPKWIGDLKALKYLYVGNNFLVAMTKQIFNLKALQVLAINHNFLDVLPDWISDLTALRQLDVRANRLTVLPDWINNHRSLRELYVRGNTLRPFQRPLNSTLSIHG